MDHKRRVQRLSKELEKKKETGSADCVAITTLPNLRYFFNYPGQSYERFCCGLISADGSRTALVIPKLDLGKSEKSSADNVFAWTDSEGYERALTEAIRSIRAKGKVIGSELMLTLGQMNQFKRVLHTSRFVPVSEEIAKLRLIKDGDEISSTKDAARRLARGYRAIPELIQAGKTEAQVGFEIRKVLSEAGLVEVDFCAVQSGPNSAIPHSETTPRKIRRGDMIVVDISGTNADGYFADYTRTYVVGSPSTKQKEVYDVVKHAQSGGVEAVTVGRRAEEVDRMARSVIERAGFGEYFVHRTGHGLGLEVHEPPWIREGNGARLENGMVFTIEPGVYLPGRFGVRIEDNLIVRDRKTEDLTQLSHELIELG